MHVDFIITELNVGGAERCLTELACGLTENAHHIRVFSLGPLPSGDQTQLVDRLRDSGITVTSGHASRPHQFIGCYRQLRSWLSEGRADVCQTFLYHANVLGTFAARAAGSRLCVGGVRVAEKKWWRCQLERRAVRRMDHVVCVSKAVADFAQHELLAETSRVHVIPNSVDVNRFANARPMDWTQFGWSPQSDIAIFVGRLHPQKGIELLQQQIDAIAPAGSNWKLLIVGDGELRTSLASWAAGVGGERVQVVGWRADVASLLKSSRLLVLPSHYEGMPNVVLEAFAAGIPVVCSGVEGSDELLSHALESQCFQPGDSEAMADRVRRFAGDPSLRRTIGEANFARATHEFAIPAMVDAYASLYRELMTRRLDVR